MVFIYYSPMQLCAIRVFRRPCMDILFSPYLEAMMYSFPLSLMKWSSFCCTQHLETGESEVGEKRGGA